MASKTITLTQTRPNLDVDFHTGSEEFKTFKSEMVAAGTLIDNGGSNNKSGLIRTWSLTFNSEDSHSAFYNNDIVKQYMQSRLTYNSVNFIIDQVTYS